MTQYVETDRGRFAYKVSGNPNGNPLLLVAGLGDDRHSWDVILHGFADYRCVTFDNRGIGSSPITEAPYSIKQMAEDAHAIAHGLGIQGCPAIGSSMGGAICQEWALKYPSDISKLVLTNTWGKTDTYCALLFDHWISLAASRQTSALVDSILLFCFSPKCLAETPSIIDEFRTAVGTVDMTGFQGAAAACRNHDALDRLDAIVQPTLIVAGSQDILTIPAHSERMHGKIKNSRIVYVEAAHQIFGESPQSWIETVGPWLEGEAAA